jgi:3-mercaptopyruvate sulfurtransferase SseA
VAGLALKNAGFENVMVYDGSMYEWSRNPWLELVSGIDDFVIRAASVDD